jgi:tetrahydromethanopterin S-methyltransferase subunit B
MSPAALSERKEKFEELTQYRYCKCNDRTTIGAHLPLTLDEYCNPSLGPEILKFRNKDQVVLRHQRKKAAERPESDQPLNALVVLQVWLWKVENVIITSMPPRIFEGDTLFRNTLGNWGLTGRIPNREQLLGLILSELVNALERPSMAGLSEPIFNIFEKAIADLSEDVNNYIRSTDVDTISIKKEKEFLHKIDDIREELSMIQTVLFQQEEVWKDFSTKAWPSSWPDGPDGQFKPPERPEDEIMSLEVYRRMWSKIQRPQIQFSKFKRRISKLDADAERVERAIDRKLDLKAKHASLREAHTMAIMSAAVFGFTIITIIFTPLSFIVTLFTLPIDGFQQQQVPSVWTNQAGMYSTNYVGKWIGE